ncbi:metallophosphoesterase family protein [Sedimentibacter sp. MB31-C6]|uniref:metallophosphoesterase family protein n=1 Tax=Sedimentibacter sp. MB31-C6 TaxID=3109366 RepID=UPI002DDDA987|nr:metallophosphoesterase [Sedimentibacter sp. MB36-C1]WSI03374.1 metallophosphoesterase [Sedimentibacter sp. MB36-C1]
MKFKFIHTSDIHLGMKFNIKEFSIKERKKRREELWDTFEEIIRIAKDEDVQYLFIVGDLTESEYISFKLLNKIAKIFESIKNTNIIISCGRSDAYNINSMYEYVEWPENVYIIKSTNSVQKLMFPEDNVCLYSLSWDKASKNHNSQLIYDISVEQNKLNILLLSCDTYMEDEMLSINADLIKNKFDYCALGGKHNYEKVQNNVIYCGTPEPLSFEEVKEHGIVKGILEKNNIFFDFHPIAKRRFIIREIELDSTFGYNKTLDLIKFSGDTFSNIKDYIKIILTGFVNTEISMDEIENEAKQFFYYIEFDEKFTYKSTEEKKYVDNEFNIVESYKLQFENLQNKLEQKALKLGFEVLRKEKVVK